MTAETLAAAPAAPAASERPDPLLLAATVLLWVLLVGVALAAIAALFGLTAQIAGQGLPWRAPPWAPQWAPIGTSLFTLAALWMVSRIVIGLLAMISAVGRGDAFAGANVARIEALAANVLGIQLLGFIARVAGTPIAGDINGFDISPDLTPAGVAFALLLFILARVFRQGARLQDDLEGTV